jgi:hypothetical protein
MSTPDYDEAIFMHGLFKDYLGLEPAAITCCWV